MAITETQREELKTCIGASEVVTALGLNFRETINGTEYYKTPTQLLMEKRGEVEPSPGGQPAYFGGLHEPVISAEYCRQMNGETPRAPVDFDYTSHSPAKNGKQVKSRLRYEEYRNKQYPWMICHLDFILEGISRCHMESKSTGQWAYTKNQKKGEWGAPMTDDVPVQNFIQVQAQMNCRERSEFVDQPVIVGGNDFIIYRIERNDEMIRRIKEGLLEFREHYQNQTVPEPLTQDDIALMYPRDDGKAIQADEMIAELDREYRSLKFSQKEFNDNLKPIENRLSEIKLELTKYIGEKSILIDGNAHPLYTFKQDKNGRLDTGYLKENHADIYKKALKPGGRRFIMKK